MSAGEGDASGGEYVDIGPTLYFAMVFTGGASMAKRGVTNCAASGDKLTVFKARAWSPMRLSHLAPSRAYVACKC